MSGSQGDSVLDEFYRYWRYLHKDFIVSSMGSGGKGGAYFKKRRDNDDLLIFCLKYRTAAYIIGTKGRTVENGQPMWLKNNRTLARCAVIFLCIQ